MTWRVGLHKSLGEFLLLNNETLRLIRTKHHDPSLKGAKICLKKVLARNKTSDLTSCVSKNGWSWS